LNNNISYYGSGLEKYVNWVLFVIIMIVSVNIIFTVVTTIILKGKKSLELINKLEGKDSASISDNCLV